MFNLPTRPTKRAGKCHANGFEGDSVELDALPPSILREMVREVIGRRSETALSPLGQRRHPRSGAAVPADERMRTQLKP
jgi:hypothetical protein